VAKIRAKAHPATKYAFTLPAIFIQDSTIITKQNDSTGTALQDVATAMIVYERALQSNVPKMNFGNNLVRSEVISIAFIQH